MSKEFYLDLIASLQQAKSKKQVNADIKILEKAINMLRLTATLTKGDTKREINNYIKELSGKLDYIKLKGKIDDKKLKREIENSLHNMTFKEIDALNIDSNKAKLKLQKAMADMKAYAEKIPISVNVSLKKEKLGNDLTTFLNKNSKLRESSILLAESEKIRELIDSVDDKGTLRNATDAFSLFKSEVISTGYAGKSTSQKIKDMLGHITKIGSFFGVASLALNNFRKSLSTLRSNDTILTEISKTSEMTKRQLKELGDEAFKVASKYGQLSGNYLLGVQEMARSGYESLSKELAELSLLAQSAGDMTADSANNYLLATDAAYKYSGSVEKLNAALDGANYISNKNSASLTDIADATRVSASFAANAGVAIDELTAAEATMIAVTKRSGSEIGRAFRSIVLNLQQVSGEFDGEVIDEEQLKKVEKTCHDLGVELEYMKDGVPTLRNTMDVLRDLAEVYNSLPDNSAEKQGLISSLGGKYHANSLSALLSRWDLYEKMLSEFSQGTGSALEEAEKTADSWEGRIAKLQNSWDSFINTLTNKEAIKGGISFFDRLIQGATELTNAIGEIPVVLTALNSALVMTNKDYGITQIWNKDNGKIDLQGNIFGIDITNIKNMKKHFAEAEGAIAGWNKEVLKGNVDINDFNEAIVKNNTQFKAYLSTCSKDAPASLEGYKAHLKAAGVSTDALRLKTILLNSAITMLGGWAIQFLVTGLYQLFQVSNNVAEKAQELGNTFKSTKSDIDDYKSKIEDLYKVINDNGSSISDVTEARKNLMVIQDELIEKFGDEEGAIKNITDAIGGQADALDELTEKQWQEAKNKFNDGDFLNDIGNWMDGYEDNFDRMVNEMENYYFVFSLEKSKRNSDFVKALEDAGYEFDSLFGTLTLHGPLESVYDDIIKIQKIAEDYGAPNSLIKELREEANREKNSLERYRNIWDTHILRDVILENEDLTQSWNDVNEAYSDYRKAFEAGDKDAQNNAIGEFAQSLNEVLDNSDVKESVKEYFRDMYPAMTREAEKWEFRFKVLPDYDIHALNGKTQADILEMLQTDGFQYGEQTFNSLLRLAGDYGIVIGDDSEKIQQLLDLLVEWEILQGDITDISETAPATFSDIFSLKDANNTLTTLGKISESIDTLQNAYKTLSDAIGEYNEEGAFSVDTLQSVIALGDNWLDYLVNGEGKLKLNKESLEQLTRARLNDMHAQAINNVINNVAKIQSDEDAIKYLTSTNYALAESYEEVAQMKLMDARASLEAAVAAGTLSEENMHAAMAKASDDIAKIKRLFMNTGIDADSILGGSGSSSSAISEKDTIKEFDWIGQAIENVEKEVKKLDEIANSSYATFSQKNAALAKEISKVNEEIVLQQQAYEEYMRKADAIGLGEDYKVLVRDGAINIENISDEDLQNKISDYQKWHEKAVAVSDAISGLNEQLKDLHVRGYELRAERLEDLLNNASITEKQYLEDMKSLYKEYYENQVEYAQKAHEAKLALLEKEKSYLNSVAGAASSLLDREIDKIRDNAEAQEKPLKNQIDAYNEQIDLLNKKKKPLQDELDALEDKARDENLILDLQQKQYNLKRLENQRTKLVYTADQGMIYTSDSSAIRDAKKDVDSAKQEIQKNDIQKQIDALDDEIDRYNDLIDLVNDQIDAVNSAADAQINALEKVKNKWQEVIDQQEYAANISLLTGEFGTNAIEKLLSGNDDDLLAQWKNSYVNTLAGLDMETQGYIGNMTQQIASLYNVELSVLQSQFQGVKDSVASLDNTIRNETDTAASAFDQHTNKLTNEVVPAIQDAATEMDTFNESAQIAESSIEKANATLSAFSETANKLPVDVFNSMAQSAQSLSGALDHIANTAIGSTSTQLKDILSDANGIVDTIKHGNAYGEGAPGLANDEKNALRSAYAGGTGKDAIITPDGAVLRPLHPGDPMYDTMQKWNAYMDGINHNVDKAVPNSMYDYNKRMHEIVNQITNSSIVNHTRNMQPVTVNQNVTLNCPNLTNNSGIEYVRRELGHLSQMATQEPLKDY